MQTRKGKSPATNRELSVVMPNGQSILVKCEVKTRAGDVFDMIVAHSNLVEHFYFGLAYIDGKVIGLGGDHLLDEPFHMKQLTKRLCSLVR